MKIQSIKFIEHPAFLENSRIEFFRARDSSVPKIFFLVGNNGEGKTSILETICAGFITNNKSPEQFKASICVSDEEIIITRNQNNYSTGLSTKGIPFYYDTLETTFTVEKISTVTGQTIDYDNEPKEKSINLAQIIPQLLVDISNQDSSFIAEKSRQGILHKDLDAQELKFTRFTNTLNKIYNGSKRFKTLRNNTELIFEDANNNECDINSLSTGEKQILFRIGGMLKNLTHLRGSVILIDEPETSLHPKWQQKYVQILLETFKDLDTQFIIATHSPYVLQGVKDGESVCIKVDRTKMRIGEQVGYYPNSIKNPSINLINYLAFDLYDELLHIELFEAILKKESLEFHEIDGFLACRDVEKRSFVTVRNRVRRDGGITLSAGTNLSETLPVYIRNAIHHPEETGRVFTNSNSGDSNDLKQSIEIMLSLL
ncbi:MAG: AAA family ATPase [Phormidium tanganyikae FI6-MK23]|jgi:predicted ATPase|nr:AAA family ATPase [Phormidium tanganyikae FI6-MK23]